MATWILFGKLFDVATLVGFSEKRCRKNLPLGDAAITDSDFQLADADGNSIRVVVCAEQRPISSHFGTVDDIDPRWLRCSVHVNVATWHGTPELPLRAENFRQFRNELATLYDTLAGNASFGASTDDLLHLQLTGNDRGRISAACSIGEVGELFTCILELDQSFVPPILGALERIESTFGDAFSRV